LSRTVPKQTLELKILDGIEDASNKFRLMSGIESLYEAPEYYVTVCVANALTRGKQSYVTLEDNIERPLKHAGGLRPGRPRKSLRIKGRSDIVIWYRSDNTPRAVIEVKHPLFRAGKEFDRDIRRLRDIMDISKSQQHSTQFCCLAFWTGADRSRIIQNPSARINVYVEKMKLRAEELLASTSSALKVRII